jgi:hypothetical protein
MRAVGDETRMGERRIWDVGNGKRVGEPVWMTGKTGVEKAVGEKRRLSESALGRIRNAKHIPFKPSQTQD